MLVCPNRSFENSPEPFHAFNDVSRISFNFFIDLKGSAIQAPEDFDI